jgi:hypothetical protein
MRKLRLDMSLSNKLIDFFIVALVAATVYTALFLGATPVINFTTTFGSFGGIISILLPIIVGVAILFALLKLMPSGKGSK